MEYPTDVKGMGRKGQNKVLLSEAFEAYREVILYKNQSSKTEECHLVCLHALLRYFGDIEVESLTFSMIREWKSSLERTVSPNTARSYVVKLRVVLGYLREEGIDCLEPSKIPIPKRTNKVPHFITEKEVEQFINAACKPRNKAIISLLFSSGVRVSELCQMNVGDIRDGMFTVVGKGNKPRLCFVDDRTKALLKSYQGTRKDHYNHLFEGKYPCHRLTPGNVQEIFRHLRDKTGIQASPHTMRHSFATNLLRNNMNIRYVQTLLGHSSLDTVAIYTHVVDKDLQREYTEKHTI